MTRVIVVVLILAAILGAYHSQLPVSKDKPSDQAPNLSERTLSEQKGQVQTVDHTNHPHDWIDRLNAFSTLVIAVFTILLFVGLIFQVRATRQIERAWVRVKRVGNPPEAWTENLKTGYVPGIAIEFSVYGKTVARISDARIVLDIIPVKKGGEYLEPALPDAPDYSSSGIYNLVGKNRMVIPPDGSFVIHGFLKHTLSDEEVDELKRGTLVMCGYGYVKYTDAFGKDRETKLCYVYDFAYGGVLRSPDGFALNPAGFVPGGPPHYNDAT